MKFILLLSLVFALAGCKSSSTIDESFLGGIAISPSKSAVVASDSSLLSGTAITLTLALRDQHGQVFWYEGSNPTVTFSTSGGTSTGLFSDVINNDDGTFTTTFAGVNAGTPTNIIASVDGVPLTSTAPAIQVLPGNYSLAHSYVSLSAASITSGSFVTATFHTYDTSGNPLTSGGFVVSFSQNGGTSTGTFSAVTDNGDGTYTATFTGGVMGTATSIRAAIAGQLITSAHPTVTVTHGPASQLVFATQPLGNVAPGVSLPSQPIVHIKDAAGNMVTSGPDATADITLSLSSGTGALAGTTTITSVAGVATFTNISVNTKGSGKIITATKENTLVSSGTGAISSASDSFLIHPPAPGAFTIASAVAGASSVVLSWNASSEATSYTVKYGTVSGTFGTTVSTSATSPTTISSLTPGTTYYFMVEASNVTATTSSTAQASATPLSAFSISSVTVDTGNKLKVAFGTSTGSTSYTVKYGTSTGNYSSTASTAASSPYEVSGLTGGTSYYIMVTAVNSSGSVNATAEAVGIPISAFSTTSLSSGVGTLSLAFNSVAGATSYDAIYDTSSKTAADSYASASTGVTSPAVVNLAAGTSYYFRGRANNPYGSVVSTNELSAASYQNFTLSIPFTSGTSASYTSSSGTNVEVTSAGYARLKPAPQVDSDDSDTGFGSPAVLTGVQWDSSMNVARLNTTTNNSQLDATWGPDWNNLVGYWRLNGTVGALAASSTITATVGANLTSSATAGMAYASSQFNQSLTFDGVDDYLSGGNIHDIGTGGLTVSAWIKTSTHQNSRIVSKSSAGADDGWFIGTVSGTITSNTVTQHNYLTVGLDGVTSATLIGKYDDGRWHHIVARFNRTNGLATVFQDGRVLGTVNISTKAGVNVTSGGIFSIGSRNGTDRYFNGNIDEVALWSTALTDTEILSIYFRQQAKYSGQILSRIMDAQATGSSLTNWTNINVATTMPFFKELPSKTVNESTTGYSSFTGSGYGTDLAGLWHFDEASWAGPGTADVLDSSGNNRHATSTGASNVTNARFGRAAAFNSNSQLISATASSDYVSAANQTTTMSAWVFPHRYIINNLESRILCLINSAGTGSSFAFGFGNGNKLGIFYGTSGVYHWSTSSLPTFTWSHVAVTYDGSCYQLYINGAANGSCLTAALNAPGSGAAIIGNYTSGNNPLYGNLDEVAIWKRTLSAAEIHQLYRRGINRIKYQVRTCANNDCSDQAGNSQGWKGPDNTSSTYFSELFNTTNNVADGTISGSASSMVFSNFGALSLSSNRYFQYRSILESDDTNTGCTYSSAASYCSPEIKSVTVGPNHYSANESITTSAASVTSAYVFINTNGFSATLGANGCSNGSSYALSPDGTNFYYWNGSTWAASTDSTTANDSSTMAANINSFPSVIGTGTLKIKTYLTSTGTSACEVDSLSVTGQKY
ncbi:LamG-like jellyroll fold domain-containing protein [Bdellovibrio reynosensis]|uniref:Fibronectin type III domain-containing protein n=1 Tax=Bdellovibrio reynosensis TaxID=2835041 RepID=A0ABY4C538_9BACT|nr:LamG-like jellyroll fold domain-containing protein [Bdellovibrio reynosensis]UOE99943.1 fibronectin type III domain-containing protein [Bdellovibrio reynosensis]